jgi:hypothetical protein
VGEPRLSELHGAAGPEDESGMPRREKREDKMRGEKCHDSFTAALRSKSPVR